MRPLRRVVESGGEGWKVVEGGEGGGASGRSENQLFRGASALSSTTVIL
jgi:hypothetical protein